MSEAVDVGVLMDPDRVMSVEQDIDQGLYDLAVYWLTTEDEGGLRDSFRRCYPVRSKEDAIKMAQLQGDMAKIFLHMAYWASEDERVAGNLQVEQGEDGNLWRHLYSRHDNSVVRSIDSSNPQKAAEHFLGPASIVTLTELIKEVDPRVFKRLNPLQIIPSGEVDATKKVDAILDFGTRNKEGKRVLRLVQLKTDQHGQIGIARIWPDDVKSSYFGSVSRTSALKILDYAKQMENQLGDVEVRCFAILVPSFDSKVCNSPIGTLSGDNEQVYNIFKEEAQREGFLPKRNKK